MRKYMTVTQADDGETFARFHDKYSEARNAKMNAECGLGWYTEIYERVEIIEDDYRGMEYRFIEA